MENAMLRLNANEGRPCLPPAAIAALIDSETLRRYPESKSLEVLIAERRGLKPENVLATAGADDAIDRAIRSFGTAGACVLSTAPAFEEYAAAAARTGSRYVCVPRAPDGPLPLADLAAAIASEKPALVVVASPDSPGGGVIAASELRELAARAREVGAAILFDVAYADFDEGREIYEEALGLPGVVSTGTFSKAYGLAGLRAGWAAGPADAIARMRESGPPFSLSTFSVAAATAALRLGEETKESFVAEVRRERPLLQEALAAFGAKTWPSGANFVTAYVPDAGAFAEALLAKGGKIRSWLGKPGRDGMIRITCPGDEAEFRTLLGAIESIRRPA